MTMRVIRALSSVFFTYHVVAVTALNFPTGNALRDRIVRPFQWYADKTAQWQSWDMFDSIPIDEKLEIAAFAVYPDGGEKKLGPILPGLVEFQDKLRLVTFFYYFDPEAEADAAWKTYSARLCKEVARREGAGAPFTLYVDFTYHRLRGLEEIRKDGVVSEKITVTKQAPCA